MKIQVLGAQSKDWGRAAFAAKASAVAPISYVEHVVLCSESNKQVPKDVGSQSLEPKQSNVSHPVETAMGHDAPDPSVLNSRLFASECSNPTAARLQSLECLHRPQETGRQKSARKCLDGPFHQRHLQLGLGLRRIAVNFCNIFYRCEGLAVSCSYAPRWRMPWS